MKNALLGTRKRRVLTLTAGLMLIAGVAWAVWVAWGDVDGQVQTGAAPAVAWDTNAAVSTNGNCAASLLSGALYIEMNGGATPGTVCEATGTLKATSGEGAIQGVSLSDGTWTEGVELASGVGASCGAIVSAVSTTSQVVTVSVEVLEGSSPSTTYAFAASDNGVEVVPASLYDAALCS